jgi:hypothetical protein
VQTIERFADGGRGVSVGGVEEVGVGSEGDAGIGVAKPAGDRPHADTLRRQGD